MGLLSRFFAPQLVVGLDIGSSAIKLVELRQRGNEYQLLRLGVEPLSPEAIVDGAIMDSSLVVDAIHHLNDQTKVKNTNYATSLSGHSVIIKKIQLPAMPPEELVESIQWEAEQYIPFDINDVRLDYVVLSEGTAGRVDMDVLLVAIKRDKVNDYVSVISQTGKTPAIVDVDAFALQTAYELNYNLDPRKTVALINMGASVTTVNILVRGRHEFTRDITLGGNFFTESLQSEFNLSFQEAEKLKRGEPVGRYTLADARDVLNTVSAEMTSEIRKTFDFFSATTVKGPVDELVLSGGCALIPNLLQMLRERFRVPTELMNPLKRIYYKESDFDSTWLRSIAPMMALAVGLATRRVQEGGGPAWTRQRSISFYAPHLSDHREDLLVTSIPAPIPANEAPAPIPTPLPPSSRPVEMQPPARQGIVGGRAKNEISATENKAASIPPASQESPILQSPPAALKAIDQQMKPSLRVFLCYSREDQNSAKRMYKELRSAGFDVWFDDESLLPGQIWESAIQRAIEESDYFIALLSTSALSRKAYSHKELWQALDIFQQMPYQDIYLIPARLDDCNPPHPAVQKIHRVDLFPDWDEGMRRILRSLRTRISAK